MKKVLKLGGPIPMTFISHLQVFQVTHRVGVVAASSTSCTKQLFISQA